MGLIIGILLFVAISSLISTGNIINKEKKGFKYLTLRGYAMIALNLLIIVLSVLQYYSNEREIHRRDLENSQNQDLRDSFLKAKYDSSLLNIKNEFDKSNTKIILTISEVLGKYGFSLDSTNKTLVRLIRDSSKTKIIEQVAPVLRLRNEDGISLVNHANNKLGFKLNVCSYDASSTDYQCIYYVIKEDSLENLLFLGRDWLLSKDLSINVNQTMSVNFSIPDSIMYKKLIIVIRGTYKNMEKTKTYNINTVDYYEKETKLYMQALPRFKERLEIFIQGMYLK